MGMQDFFFEGMTTDAERAQIMNSDSWPLIVAVINATEGRARVGFTDMRFGQRTVYLVNEVGFHVATIGRDIAMKYYVDIANDGHDLYRGRRIAKSKRPKYIGSKLRKPKDDLIPSAEYQLLQNGLKNSDNTVNSLLRSILVDTLHTMYRSHESPYASLNSDAATILLRLYKGDLKLSDIPSTYLNTFDASFIKYMERRNNFEKSFKSARDLFSADKWVLFYEYGIGDLSKSVIVGAVSHHPTQVAIDRYVDSGSVPLENLFSYSDIIHPFKWYPSFEHIPDEIRKNIEIQLMMYKVNSNSDQLFPKPSHSLSLWTEGGVACYMETNNSARVVIVDKSP